MVSLITGITGQDGSYLSEKLLSNGGIVHGLVRRASQFNRNRIEHLRDQFPDRLFLHYADLADATNLRRLLISIQPDELYHLAGQSHVGLSFDIPESTFDEVAVGTLSLLEICRDLDSPPRVLLIGSSEIFGEPEESPQSELTRHNPTSPYGCAKSSTMFLGQVYRDSFGLFVSCAIPYNHESIRRGLSFVTRKITHTAARIARGSEEILELGNLDGARDWGHAPEYVDGMTRIIGYEKPDSFVLATGTLTSVREFVSAAFESLGKPLRFEGEGISEVGLIAETGKMAMRVNERFFRPADPSRLKGDSSKAKAQLGWSPGLVGSGVAARMAEEEVKILETS